MNIKEIVKQKIQNNASLYVILKLIKNINNVEYIEKIREASVYSYKNISLRYNENATRDVIIGEVDCASDLDGFFAAIKGILNVLYFCDQLAILPVVKMPDNWIYYDEQMSKEKNPFEYFFEQPSGISVQEINECKVVYECKPQHRLMAERLNDSDRLSYLYTEKYISEMSKIVEKYLRFNEETKTTLSSDLESKKINSKVLGVHVRGTDYKQNCNEHPTFVEPSDYFEHIDIALEKGFEKIYLATDDTEIVDLFVQKYGGERLIYDEAVTRGQGDVGVHIKERKNKNGYKLGLDVIKDMYSLANCGGLISGVSQVSLFARLFNRTFDEHYSYDVIVSKKINSNNKNFSS